MAGIEDRVSALQITNARLLEERNKLLQIFPEEIWLLLFDRYVPSDFLETICNTSPYFRELLSEKRVIFLFPKVWKILGLKYHKNYLRFNYRDPSFQEELLAPLLIPGSRPTRGRQQWFSGILRLRQTCKTWNNVVDNFYHTYYSTEVYTQMFYMRPQRELRNSSYWSIDNFDRIGLPRIPRFVQHFRPSHEDSPNDRSPFITRAVNLYYYRRYPNNNRNDNLEPDPTSLLAKYGHHVWFCTVEITVELSFWSHFYSKLREWINLMPNLRVLHLYQYAWLQEMDTTELEDAQEQLAQLTQLIAANPPPNLKNMHYFRAENIFVPIFNAVLHANTQVSRLEIIPEKMLHGYMYDFYSVPLPNLVKLKVNLFLEMEFEHFSNPGVNWPLTWLDLDLWECEFIDWADVFNVLGRKFANTLTTLYLVLPKSRNAEIEKRIIRESSAYALNLPKLKYLNVLMGNLACADYILPMKQNIEELEIGFAFCVEELIEKFNVDSNGESLGGQLKVEQKVDVLGFTERLRESNVWSLFPNLKSLTFSEFQRGQRRAQVGRDTKEMLIRKANRKDLNK